MFIGFAVPTAACYTCKIVNFIKYAQIVNIAIFGKNADSNYSELEQDVAWGTGRKRHGFYFWIYVSL